MNTYTSGATASAGVALAYLNGVLWVAFPGGGGLGAAAPNYKLNIMPVQPASANDAWSFERLLVLEQETTMEQPALTAFNGKLWLAWTGTDAAHRLNLLPLTVDSRHNTLTAGTKIVLNWTATGGPALTVRHIWVNAQPQQHLYLAFCGGGGFGGGAPNGALNFAYSADGVSWPDSLLVVWNDYHSLLSPSLTQLPTGIGTLRRPPGLYFAFTGTDHRLYFGGPTDYANVGYLTHGDANTPETSDYAPAISAFRRYGGVEQESVCFCVWTGAGSDHRLYYLDNLGSGEVLTGSHTVYSDTSAFAPAVLGVDELRYVAWAGTDAAHRVNIGELAEMPHTVS